MEANKRGIEVNFESGSRHLQSGDTTYLIDNPIIHNMDRQSASIIEEMGKIILRYNLKNGSEILDSSIKEMSNQNIGLRIREIMANIEYKLQQGVGSEKIIQLMSDQNLANVISSINARRLPSVETNLVPQSVCLELPSHQFSNQIAQMQSCKSGISAQETEATNYLASRAKSKFSGQDVAQGSRCSRQIRGGISGILINQTELDLLSRR